MTAKPRLLLPDTMVILTAMRLQRWVPICRRFEVVVPAIIAAETRFFDDADGRRVYLDLEPAPTTGKHRFAVRASAAATLPVPVAGPPAADPVADGEFTCWHASAIDLIETGELLHPELSPKVDDGEKEAVTYLRLADEPHDIWFVTADSGGIQASVAFGFSDCPVSLSAVLKNCGQQIALDVEFHDEHVKECIRLGKQRVATGRALAPPCEGKPRKKP